MCKHLRRFPMANYILFTFVNIYLICMMRMADSKKEVNKSFDDNLLYCRGDKMKFWHGLKYLLIRTSITNRFVIIYTKCKTISIYFSTIIRYKIFNNIFSSNQDQLRLFLQAKPTSLPLLLFS